VFLEIRGGQGQPADEAAEFPGRCLDEERRQLDLANPQRGFGDVLPQGLADAVFGRGALPALLFVRIRLPGPVGVVADRDRPTRDQREGGPVLLVEGNRVLLLVEPEGPDVLKGKTGRQLRRQVPGKGGTLGRFQALSAFERQVHRTPSRPRDYFFFKDAVSMTHRSRPPLPPARSETK
jgi:hypothetical protein